MNLLTVSNLTIDFKKEHRIIHEVNFAVKENSVLGIVGESGSGKSMTCKAILGLLDQSFTVQGEIEFNGVNLLEAKGERMRQLRGKEIGMILQNPMTAFHPLYTVGNQMIETLREHLNGSSLEAEQVAMNALKKMKFEDPQSVFIKYPHQLSGGMLQRVMIAIALSLQPKILIADEPTTALDAITQYEIIQELKEIRNQYNTSIIIISHDLGVISTLADSVLVFQHGHMIESGKREKLFSDPKHEHTKFLLRTKQALVKKYEEVFKMRKREDDILVIGS